MITFLPCISPEHQLRLSKQCCADTNTSSPLSSACFSVLPQPARQKAHKIPIKIIFRVLFTGFSPLSIQIFIHSMDRKVSSIRKAYNTQKAFFPDIYRNISEYRSRSFRSEFHGAFPDKVSLYIPVACVSHFLNCRCKLPHIAQARIVCAADKKNRQLRLRTVPVLHIISSFHQLKQSQISIVRKRKSAKF